MAALACRAGDAAWQVCTNFTCFIDWLDHWQTMLTGVGAVAAAVLSVSYLRKQIAEAARQENDRRSRRLAAARSRLQLSLSEATHYANESMGLLKLYLDNLGAAGAPPAAPDRPALPYSAIPALEAIIEATDDEEFAGMLSDLISGMQVLSARLGAIAQEGPNLTRIDLNSYLLTAAEVHALASGMFPYATRSWHLSPFARLERR